MRRARHWTLPRQSSTREASSVEPPTMQGERRTRTWCTGAIALSIVIAGAAGATVTPLMRTVEAAVRGRNTTCVEESARNCPDVVRGAPPAGADDALPARSRKPIRKRSGRRFGTLPASAAPRSEWLVAGIPTIVQGAPPDGSASDRTPARAPPAAHPA